MLVRCFVFATFSQGKLSHFFSCGSTIVLFVLLFVPAHPIPLTPYVLCLT